MAKRHGGRRSGFDATRIYSSAVWAHANCVLIRVSPAPPRRFDVAAPRQISKYRGLRTHFRIGKAYSER